MKLSQLLKAAGLPCFQEAEITSLTCDSREVEPGALFAALEGARIDGNTYISKAVEQGAAAVLRRELPVPAVETQFPRKVLGRMAAEFYGRPAEQMTVIAVTGTKGKTTTAHMLREILTAAGYKTGMIGTLGAFVGQEQLAQTVNTTPEPIALHRLLRQMADAGCSHVVMEASSQAMKLDRLEGIRFDVGIFLNLSPDHIGPGEHESFEEYRHCKAQLLQQCCHVVGNEEDPAWPYMMEHCLPGTPIHTFAVPEVCPGPNLTTRVGDYVIPLPGAFHAQNAMAAVTAAQLLGIPETAIRSGLARTAVPGRCMVYPTETGYGVVIDYAHNEASFRALFGALRERGVGRILAVFGAGGDRPPMRRQALARAAAEGTDFAVITEDNPRTESVEAICRQIGDAMPDLPHVIIPDRRAAIFHALDLAEPGDVVALLGKGHETYIERNGIRHFFSEWEVLEDYFRA